LAAAAAVGAGLAAGTINTVVGSGTLITFPTFLALGYPPLVANVSNTIGLVPGSLSGVHAYRKELGGSDQRRRAVHLGCFSLLGAVAGAVLLLALPGTAFKRVVPFLILMACALVVLQPRVSRWLRRRRSEGAGGEGAGRAEHLSPVLLAVVFATGVYGGYFGAAQGVILISFLGIFISDNLQRLNALKNVLALLANLVAGVVFAFSGHVSWSLAAVMAVGAVVGGQVGGRVGRRLPQPVLRATVVVVGTAVAAYMLA
jgi:hypothetical protein